MVEQAFAKVICNSLSSIHIAKETMCNNLKIASAFNGTKEASVRILEAKRRQA